jgi:DNA-directed RNA polymerase specialized sigma24 family protein
MSHPLGQNPEAYKRMPDERFKEIALKIRTGTSSDADLTDLVKSYIRYAIKVAAAIASASNEQDCASAGLFGVVYAARKAHEKLVKFTANQPDTPVEDLLHRWIVSCVKRHIRRYLELNHTVRTPESTYRLNKKKGKTLETVNVVPLDERPTDRRRPIPRRASSELSDVRELLTLSVQKEHDSTIIQMRAEGYKDVEIAERIQMSVAYVQRCRAAIEERYDALDRN